MSAADLAVVLVTLAAAAAFVVLVVAATSLLRTARALRASTEHLESEVRPLVAELRTTVALAGAEVDRVDELLDTAAAIQQTVDHASRLTFVAFANPLIKFVAFMRGIFRGTGRALGSPARRRRRVSVRREERAAKRARRAGTQDQKRREKQVA